MSARVVLCAALVAAGVQPAAAAENPPPPQSPQHADEHAGHRTPAAPRGGDAQAEHQHPPEHVHHAEVGDEPTQSEREHVAPDPPQHLMSDMSKERMIELMQMEDDGAVGLVLLDQLEWRELDDADAQVWEFDAWYGDDYNKLWFETEGERVEGDGAGRVELMWDRIISPWWSLQTGVRHDFGEGPSRTWLDLGVQGLAPYFFEIDAAIYLGEEGRTAVRFSAEYDMLLTQRLVLQPELEFNLYGKSDPENGVGSGLADAEVGLRLRYEIRREFAPYVGVHWERKFGRTADLAGAEGDGASDIGLVLGLRAWF
jgi:copper resistance protein B